ncbi:hypothetical protein RclHR1_15800005 [Rhizophagus clarus]|uniref:HAT C-terminal dimerisation domain-containing protein n=1 Tax=Rhizophagus clarus TaxID=94130 RepID=A0A2Z6QTM7_9GLOM|nr:hypothetical protein RclHR1_15800005 [Rhizophagus clarus]
MTISNGWAFQWVENQVTIEFFNFISPLLQLPSRKTLADEILKNTAKNVQNNIEIAAKEDKYDGQVLIWGAKDISGDRENTDAAVKHISAFLNETQAKNIKINTVITDSASKQLRRIHDDIVFLSCFAHQANLCVADVLKSSPKLLKASKNATAIVKYFNASSKFTKDLRDEQKRIYNKYIMLIKPGKTHWNSYYFCYQSSLAGRNDLSDVTVIQECNDENYKEMMSSRLERRWKTWEQPLLILSFFLHPSYKLQFFASDPKLSYINLNKWVQYYYIKWFELEQTPLDYWSFLSDSVPELSQVATKLFSICVNSVSYERLFSSMGFLHTKRWNKLNILNVLFINDHNLLITF